MMKIRLKNVLFNALVIFTTLIFAFVVYAVASGMEAYAVQTDSMSPTFDKGSVVFVDEITFDELRVGSIVSVKFKDGSGIFTHRVTEIDPENKKISTKGDNNASEDPEQSDFEQVIGRVRFSVPYVGYLPLKLMSNTIIYFIASLAVVLFAARLTVEKITRQRNKNAASEADSGSRE